MTEAQLSTRIQAMLKGVHWQRIENSVGVGAPDLHGCFEGKDLWLELKIHGGAPTRAAQTVWHLRRRNAGGKSHRLTYHPKYKMIFVDMIDYLGNWYRTDSFALNHQCLSNFVKSI